MIKTKNLFKFLQKEKIDFFTGVPDSVLKSASSFFESKKEKHFITANEGSSIAMAAGYYLATKKIPCVYMQNSGLGNAINPLISISHKKVYSIPILIIIGWRGSPGIKDEPQHNVKGKITTSILKLLNIRYLILNNDSDLKKLKKLIKFSKTNSTPVAILLKKNILINNITKAQKKISNINKIQRSDIIEKLLKKIKKNTKLIATTGFTARELNQIRSKKKINKGNDFYMVGGMGHSSVLSLGISIKTNHEVICLDGDGSFLMHLGSIVSIGKKKRKNFKHILFNNFSHESVGGQSTNIDKVNVEKLIKSVGYKNYFLLKKKREIENKLKIFLKKEGPSLLEVRTKIGTIKDLSRPKNLIKIKKNFINSF